MFSQVVSCLEGLPSNIFLGLHIFRFCHLCYITHSVFNYTANVPEDCNLWPSLSRNFLNSVTAKPDYRDQRTLTTAGFSWNVQYQPAVVAGSRSFLGLKADVMIICDVTMVFFAIQTISFTKINLVYETSVFTLALLTFQQPVQRTLKIIILLMANTQLTASLDLSKATNMMTVWNSEITFDKMNTVRICISEIYSTDRIRSIKSKRQSSRQNRHWRPTEGIDV